MTLMERIRVYFDADEELRLALKTVALREGITVSAVIERVLKREFPKDMAEARKTLQQREKSKSSD